MHKEKGHKSLADFIESFQEKLKKFILKKSEARLFLEVVWAQSHGKIQGTIEKINTFQEFSVISAVNNSGKRVLIFLTGYTFGLGDRGETEVGFIAKKKDSLDWEIDLEPIALQIKYQTNTSFLKLPIKNDYFAFVSFPDKEYSIKKYSVTDVSVFKNLGTLLLSNESILYSKLNDIDILFIIYKIIDSINKLHKQKTHLTNLNLYHMFFKNADLEVGFLDFWKAERKSILTLYCLPHMYSLSTLYKTMNEIPNPDKFLEQSYVFSLGLVFIQLFFYKIKSIRELFDNWLMIFYTESDEEEQAKLYLEMIENIKIFLKQYSRLPNYENADLIAIFLSMISSEGRNTCLDKIQDDLFRAYERRETVHTHSSAFSEFRKGKLSFTENVISLSFHH
jgi:hypothetical protein